MSLLLMIVLLGLYEQMVFYNVHEAAAMDTYVNIFLIIYRTHLVKRRN